MLPISNCPLRDIPTTASDTLWPPFNNRFSFIFLFRQFVHFIRRRIEMLTSSRQEGNILFTTQLILSPLTGIEIRDAFLSNPPQCCVQYHENKGIIITRSYCNCAATADKSMLSLFPPLPQRKRPTGKEKCWYTHRHEAGRYPQGRECYGPSMLILCKFIRYPKRVIFSRGDIWARVIPTTRMTCEIQMHKGWTKSIFSFLYTSNNNTGKMGASRYFPPQRTETAQVL